MSIRGVGGPSVPPSDEDRIAANFRSDLLRLYNDFSSSDPDKVGKIARDVLTTMKDVKLAL